jgi:hypothetical protein
MIRGGGSGGTTVINNISAIDAQSFAKFARQSSAAFVAAVNAGQRNGSTVRTQT